MRRLHRRTGGHVGNPLFNSPPQGGRGQGGLPCEGGWAGACRRPAKSDCRLPKSDSLLPKPDCRLPTAEARLPKPYCLLPTTPLFDI
ncbi:hypothetical protein GCM10007904_23710 [Oharaeibacter diazotrophicus]|nr:hypothetical protein GCM10007904_23710 [Oharaeibacter diazotrophicus]